MTRLRSDWPGRIHPTPLLRAIALVLLLASVGACRRGRSSASTSTSAPTAPMVARLRLGTVEVSDATADRPDGAPLVVAAIAGVIRRKMLSSGLFEDQVSADGAAPVLPVVRVRANVGVEFVEVADKGVFRSGVNVKLDTRPSETPGAIEEELSAAGEQVYATGSGSNRRALAQALAERTVGDLLGGFAARAHLRVATPEEIHAEIAEGDGGTGASSLREEAIRIAGLRGLRAEVPLLLSLLQNDNEATRDAALGALIALRERRAVSELTRNRSLRDRHEMRKILDAIAILGGEEASEYLSFVAESHEDEEIRKLAADAKARMERRAAAKP